MRASALIGRGASAHKLKINICCNLPQTANFFLLNNFYYVKLRL